MTIMTREKALGILGIDEITGISKEIIKKKYAKLAMKYHPDTSGSDTSDQFKKVNEAYSLLIEYLKNKRNPDDDSPFTTSQFKSTKHSGFMVRDTYVLLISLDEFIKKDSIKILGYHVELPNYVTPYLEIVDKKNNKVIPIHVELSDTTIQINKYSFRYAVIGGIACTILENDDAYNKVFKEGIAVTPFGEIGLIEKPKVIDDNILMTNFGIYTEDPLGRVVKSLLIIAKEKQKND